MKNMDDRSASLHSLFAPKSIAVIGASRNPTSIGGKVVHGLLQNHFTGNLYPVNPNATEIQGVKAFASASQLPKGVDVAVIAVPAASVLTIVDQCHEQSIRNLVVITADFAEAGAAGKKLQAELLEKVRRYGMRMVGPNCFGILNTDPRVSMNASFSPVFPATGNIAMASQSGALGLTILGLSQHFQVGLSSFVSMGNKADLSSNDLIEYWEIDTQTKVILLYLESFGNPRRFGEIARRVGKIKPIVAVKSGRTSAGSRAAGSHTAALANNDTAVAALFHQTGVLRAETVEEMFDLGMALSYQPVPKGRRVGVITNAGGPAILCTDACETGRIKVPEFSETLREKLKQTLSNAASVRNPVDMVASAVSKNYTETIAAVLASKEVDALIVLYSLLEPEIPSDLKESIVHGIETGRKNGAADIPVFFCLMMPEPFRAPLQTSDEKIPVYGFPEKPALVLSKLCDYAEWQAQPAATFVEPSNSNFQKARTLCQNSLKEFGEGWLSQEKTRELFELVGMPLPPSGVGKSLQEAQKIASEVGYPVAVKLASRTLVHKTEIGGVQLNLADANAVASAFQKIEDGVNRLNKRNEMEGVLVQPMIPGGSEMIIGMNRDKLFGPLIAFGLGGVYVEILSDIVFRVAPLSEWDAEEMLNSIRGAKLLEGYRGHPAADKAALKSLILLTAQLAQQIPEITTLDLNPVMALAPGKGCWVVDARLEINHA